MQHPEFLPIVEKTWAEQRSQLGVHGIWLKLQSIKVQLKKLNTKEFSRIDGKVDQCRKLQQEIQHQMRDPAHQQTLFEQEKDLRERLEKWVLIQESILK